MSLLDLTPADLGLPSKFQEFRKIQYQMASYALYGPSGDPADTEDRRFRCLGAPPGSGKSAFTHFAGRLTGEKYVVLTATRSLEDQYLRDGFDCASVRGRTNYVCLDDEVDAEKGGSDATCEHGEQNDCRYYGTLGCAYNATVDFAKGHRAPLTNYQYWMNARVNRAALELDGGSDPIRWLFCDEAHLIPTELSRHLGVWFSNYDLRKYAPDEHREALQASKGAEWGKVGEKWLVALGAACGRVVGEMAEIADQYPNAGIAKQKDSGYRKLDKVKTSLERILRLGTDNNWIWRYAGQGIAFDCIWPARYANSYLWSGVPHIVLESASLRPKSLQLSGVPKSERWFKEWPRVFPPHLSPVVFVETDPPCRMGVKASEEQRMQSVWLLDEMARKWEGRRGIVHTPSFKLAEWLYAKSRYTRRMVLHEQGSGPLGARRASEKYRATEGAILMSPSFHTGHDFPDDACEWQFIPKLPFPDRSDPIVLARCEDDPDYYNAETMQRFQQSCGRGTRHDEDTCTTLVGDHAVKGFRYYAKEFGSQWFKVQTRKEIPGPK